MKLRYLIAVFGVLALCCVRSFGTMVNDASLVDQPWDGFEISQTAIDGTSTTNITMSKTTGTGGTAPAVNDGELTVTMVGATAGSTKVSTGSLDTFQFHTASNYVITTRMKVTNFPDADFSAASGAVGIDFFDIRGMDRIWLHLQPGSIWVNHANNDWVCAALITTSPNTWYIWQFNVCQVDGAGAGTVDIYRRELESDPWMTVATNVTLRDQVLTDQLNLFSIAYNADNTRLQGRLISDYFQIGGVPEPVLYVSFDGDLNGTGISGVVTSSASSGTAFTNGLRDQAVQFGTNASGESTGYVEYASVFSNSAGTVMFWARPDGLDTVWPTYQYNLFEAYCASAANDSTNERVRMFVNRMLKFSAYQDGDSSLQFNRYIGEIWPQGEWRHLAFSWNTSGEVQLYVNGLPYQHGPQAVAGMELLGTGHVTLQDIQRVYLGSPPDSSIPASKSGMAFDEFKVFRKALSSQQVSDEYRLLMPVDMTLKRCYLRASEAESVCVEISAGGQLETPQTGIMAPVPVSMNLTLNLTTLAGSSVKTTNFSLAVTGAVEKAVLNTGSLAAGSYRLVCTFPWQGTTCRRVFAVEVYQPQAAPEASADPLELGGLIDSVDCSQTGHGYVSTGATQVVSVPGIGTYREAGTNQYDRFSYEVNFTATNGAPVVLEITWPEDRPRSMGLYMYRESSSTAQNRDRLEGGIQSGVEYPCAGGMTKTRYIFYPWFGRYLFEARTMVPGYPAAVSRIDVYAVNGRLPRLPVVTPEGAPQRLFGHMDEDQTFEIPINCELEQKGLDQKRNVIAVLESLLDYMDYTGQNAMSYPFIRYNYVYEDLPGAYDSIGFRTKGWQQLMLDMFEQRGKKLIATCNLTGLPEDLLAPDQYTAEYALRDRYGNVVKNDWTGDMLDPAHPELRQRFLRHISDVIADVGAHPAFAGMDLWFLENKSPWSFHSLDYGYGDFTVGLFEQQTNISLGISESATNRFDLRYQALTSTHRAQWLQWRSEKVTELVSEIDTMLQNVNTNLSLYLSLAGWGRSDTMYHENEEAFNFTNLFYETYSMDLGALAALPSVMLTPQRQPTWSRWQQYFYADRDPYITESTANELMWDPGKFVDVRAMGRTASWSYYRYFEGFRNSLNPSEFNSNFQSADVKPHGRYFLQELVQALAATDGLALLLGGQPLGMAGRDGYAREFVRAYRALPAEAFTDVEGTQDPVAVRYLQTPATTYVYAANLSFFSLTGAVYFAGSPTNATDLSTEASLTLTNGVLAVELKPFELRSFRLASSANPTNWTVSIPAEAAEWCQDKFAQITNMPGSAAGVLTNVTAQIQTDIDNGKFADAYRLMTSKQLQTGDIVPELPFPPKAFIDEDWNDLDVNAGDTTNRIGWSITAGAGGMTPSVSGGELTVTMVGSTNWSAKTYTGNLNGYSNLFSPHYLVTIRLKVSQFPDISFSAANGITIEGLNPIDIRRGKRLMTVLTPTNLWINSTAAWTAIPVSTASNVWYTWAFDVHDDEGVVNVYRRQSDTNDFTVFATNIAIRTQDVTDQVYANTVYYNGDNTKLQGVLIVDYFQLKSLPESIIYQSSDMVSASVATGSIARPLEFYIQRIDTVDGSNVLSWYTSDDMGSEIHFAIYRSTALALEWTCVDSNLVRSLTGENMWADTNPPTNTSVFYRVHIMP
jgi:hypothetical protein